MLTSKERAFLRSHANTLPALHQIGKEGVTDAVCKALSEALEKNELIKIKILETADMETKPCAAILADETNSNIVQCIGRVVVLYRPHREKEKRKYLR